MAQIYTNLLTFHTLERTSEWLALEDSPFKKYYYIVLYVSMAWRPEDNLWEFVLSYSVGLRD